MKKAVVVILLVMLLSIAAVTIVTAATVSGASQAIYEQPSLSATAGYAVGQSAFPSFAKLSCHEHAASTSSSSSPSY